MDMQFEIFFSIPQIKFQFQLHVTRNNLSNIEEFQKIWENKHQTDQKKVDY